MWNGDHDGDLGLQLKKVNSSTGPDDPSDALADALFNPRNTSGEVSQERIQH